LGKNASVLVQLAFFQFEFLALERERSSAAVGNFAGGPGAEASTAPAPALSLQKVALWVLTALLCLSLATKAQGLSPLYGPGKLYAGGLLQLSEVFEVGTLALLYADRPLGVLALFMYVGGTAHALAFADSSPEASGTGSATAMHLQLVLTVLATLLNITNKGGFVSRLLQLRTLAPAVFLKVGCGAMLFGALFSFAVSRHGIPAL